MKLEHFIECPRFGGSRPAPACVHYDRYRLCRKKCKSLEAYLKNNKDFQKELDHLKEKEKNKLRYKQPDLFTQKFSGKNLPDSSLRCSACRFTAKSDRGLKIHKKRSHSVKTKL